MTAIPPPPPPSPPQRSVGPVLYAIGGVVVALLATLIVVLLTDGSGTSDETTGSTVAAPTSEAGTSDPTAAPTTAAVAPDSTGASGPALFDLQSGDVVSAGVFGVRVLRGSLVVATPVTEPTQTAFATPEGDIVHHSPHPDEYPDYWPSNATAGAPALWRLHPDGTSDLLYGEGASLRVFEITVVPDVAPGPSVVLLRSDVLEDFPFRTDSLVIVPLDGSSPYVIPEVSGFESIITGAAWMDGFFAVSLAGEGIEAFDAYDLDGQRIPWPGNPEPGATRDFDIHVSRLTRVGMTSRIAYTRSADYPFQAPVELVVFDTATSSEVAAVPILVAGFDASMLSSSDDLIIASVVQDTGVGAWPYVQSTMVVVDTAAFIVDGIDQIGTAAVVP